jgi:hypothetical protein
MSTARRTGFRRPDPTRSSPRGSSQARHGSPSGSTGRHVAHARPAQPWLDACGTRRHPRVVPPCFRGAHAQPVHRW